MAKLSKQAFLARMAKGKKDAAKNRKSKPRKQKRKPKRIFSERKEKGTPAKMSRKMLRNFGNKTDMRLRKLKANRGKK